MQNCKLLIDPSCEHTRREVHSYSFPVDRQTGEVIPGVNPADKANHTCDAIRYATTDVLDDDGGGRWGDGGAFWIRPWGPPRY